MKDRMTMDEAREYCLKMERDRERYHRTTRQGSFESAILSLDAHMAGFDDPSKIAAFSDGGRGAERIYASAEMTTSTRRVLAELPEADRQFVRDFLQGKRWAEMGIPKRTYNWKIQKILKIIAHHPQKPSH